MSGAQIGGAIGFVVGAYFGNPQLGYVIGSAIGGYVDPEVIKLPGIGDASNQTATDGIPIPVVYGLPPPFAGNLIDGDPKARKIKVKQQQGKGGPIIIEERFLLSSAIGICEGPIDGIAFIIKDGQLVYDKRVGSQVIGDTAKFESKIRIYLGTEDQLPDPTLEAIHGVGNTPYYRGLAYMVIKDDDRTETRGAVGQYQFGVVKNGVTSVVTTEALSQPRLSAFRNAAWPLADRGSDYEYQAFWVNGAVGVLSPVLDSILLCNEWFEDETGIVAPDLYIGYSANTLGNMGPISSGLGPGGVPLSFSETQEQADVTDMVSLTLLYQWILPSVWYDTLTTLMCGLTDATTWIGSLNGCVVRQLADGGLTSFANCGSTSINGYYPYCINVRRKFMPSVPEFGDPCEVQHIVLMPDTPEIVVDCDGTVSVTPDVTPAPAGYRVLANSVGYTGPDGMDYYANYTLGPVVASSDPNFDDEAFWTAAYNAAVANGDLPDDWVYEDDYPVAGSEAVLSSIQTTTIDPGEITLQEIEEDVASRCTVPTVHINCTELGLDIVPGYLIAVGATGADALRPLQQVYFHDMPEFDGQIQAIKRGKPSVLTLNDDDFIDLDEGDEEIRRQETEYPRKLHLAYPDPDGNYAITKQTDPRYSPDIRAVGEEVIPTPIPFNRDEAAQRIAIMQKVAWSSQEGTLKRTLPEEFTGLVASDCVNYNGKRYRIDKRDEGEGAMAFEAVYDRASAYESVATGAAPLPPETPVSGLYGPTTLALMNLPSLRSMDNVPGIYVAMGNILDAWYGAQLWMSADGGISYTLILQTSQPATLGHTTADIDNSGDPIPVKVHGELESITDEQITARMNGFVLLDEGVAEIGQFQTAVDTATNEYDLEDISRGMLGTDAVSHPEHTRFVLLDANVHFIPLDISLADKTLLFRPITLGTPAANHATYSFVFRPIFTTVTVDQITVGGDPLTVLANPIYVVT